jgi:hypothetical protein
MGKLRTTDIRQRVLHRAEAGYGRGFGLLASDVVETSGKSLQIEEVDWCQLTVKELLLRYFGTNLHITPLNQPNELKSLDVDIIDLWFQLDREAAGNWSSEVVQVLWFKGMEILPHLLSDIHNTIKNAHAMEICAAIVYSEAFVCNKRTAYSWEFRKRKMKKIREGSTTVEYWLKQRQWQPQLKQMKLVNFLTHALKILSDIEQAEKSGAYENTEGLNP